MNKKVIIGIVAVILVLCVALGIFFIFNNRALDTDNSSNTNNNNNANETVPNESQDEDIEDNTDDTTSDTGNVLVVYFSASSFF